MLGFRHADTRFAPLWETTAQPAARWHAAGEGPAHYFADTPDGAWAEFLRHEEITDPADLDGIERAVWAMELPDAGYVDVGLPLSLLTGGPATYPACRAEAARLRAAGASALRAPSAALQPGGAAGWRVEAGLQPGRARDGRVHTLFGPRPDLIGWRAAVGRPSAELLSQVRHFSLASTP
jgi:hypothetical protein